MERASGHGCCTEHSANPHPGSEPAEGVGPRALYPGRWVLWWHRCPVFLQHCLDGLRTVPQCSSTSLLWALVFLSVAGSSRRSDLPHGEQGLPGLWSPETDGVLDQGWPCKPTPCLWECQGSRIPGDWGSCYTRPSHSEAIHVSPGAGPQNLQSRWAPSLLVSSAGCLGRSWFPSVSFSLVPCG